MPKKKMDESSSTYRKAREAADFSREQAEEATYISKDRIYNIENRGVTPTPDEVLAMSKAYRDASLCNYYCSKECAIGINHDIPEIQMKDLSRITLNILSSLASVERVKDKLIDISADGTISEDEYADFISVKETIDKISFSVNALQLWINQAVTDEVIPKAIFSGELT